MDNSGGKNNLKFSSSELLHFNYSHWDGLFSSVLHVWEADGEFKSTEKFGQMDIPFKELS